MLYSAQLSLEGVQMNGSLSIGEGLRFTPSNPLDAEDASLVGSIGVGAVTWGTNGTRYKQPVQVLAHPQAHQLEGRPQQPRLHTCQTRSMWSLKSSDTLVLAGEHSHAGTSAVHAVGPSGDGCGMVPQPCYVSAGAPALRHTTSA